ncbi:MAG: tRNA (adenine-N1)-methyltransferase [Crenarchaeota archaeon]|nr:tRNA (adenine-N1)-methyltransferase [Thermoproteota archaeon]
MASSVEEGSELLIYVDRRRKWIVRVERGKVFGSDRGTARHDDMIGREVGSSIELSAGFKAYLLRPLLIDYLERGFARRTQVLYPKDMGLILLLLGIGPGSRVLEAGIGSGFMTAVLANAVRPSGKVYAYEVREEFAEVALRNLRRVGLDRFVEVKIRDVKQGVEERDLDAALLDMPDPWDALGAVHEALRPSAPIVFFLPTASQVDKLLYRLREFGGFIDVRVFETLLREYRPVPGALRPETVMVGHTGYIVFARKVLKEGSS